MILGYTNDNLVDSLCETLLDNKDCKEKCETCPLLAFEKLKEFIRKEQGLN